MESSYQRRKRDIEFYRQRGEDLEQIVMILAKQIKELGATPRLSLGHGIDSDRYLNDINSGEFAMRILSL